MKLYYVENVTGFDEVEQFYIADFGFGFLVEFGPEGEIELTYRDWDEFYVCWDNSVSFERCPKRGKEFFEKHAVKVRVV